MCCSAVRSTFHSRFCAFGMFFCLALLWTKWKKKPKHECKVCGFLDRTKSKPWHIFVLPKKKTKKRTCILVEQVMNGRTQKATVWRFEVVFGRICTKLISQWIKARVRTLSQPLYVESDPENTWLNCARSPVWSHSCGFEAEHLAGALTWPISLPELSLLATPSIIRLSFNAG